MGPGDEPLHICKVGKMINTLQRRVFGKDVDLEKLLYAAGNSLKNIILRYLVKLETHIAHYQASLRPSIKP